MRALNIQYYSSASTQVMEEAKAALNGKRLVPTNGSAFGSYTEPAKTLKQITETPNEDFSPPEANLRNAPEKILADPKRKNECRRLIFRGVVYSIGDTVLIRESEKTNMIGRIERIIGENGDPSHPQWPMIELTWSFFFQRMAIFHRTNHNPGIMENAMQRLVCQRRNCLGLAKMRSLKLTS